MNSIKLISSSKNFCPRFNGKLLSRYSNPKAYADSCIPFFICQNIEEKIWVALSNFFFPFHQCKTENTIVINFFACKEHFLQGKQGKTTPFFSVLKKKKRRRLIHRYLNLINHVIPGFTKRAKVIVSVELVNVIYDWANSGKM